MDHTDPTCSDIQKSLINEITFHMPLTLCSSANDIHPFPCAPSPMMPQILWPTSNCKFKLWFKLRLTLSKLEGVGLIPCHTHALFGVQRD